jgi:hypothetical protein
MGYPLFQDSLNQAQAAPPAQQAAPSFGESLSSSFNLSADDSGWNGESAKLQAAQSIIDALPAEAKKTMWLGSRQLVDTNSGGTDRLNGAYAALTAYRQLHPAFLPEAGKSQTEYEAGLISKQAATHAQNKDIAARSGWLPNFLGGAAGMMTDPKQAAGMILSGGIGGFAETGLVGFGKFAAREALVNGALAAVSTPDKMTNRAALGDPMSARDALGEIGMAAAGGAVLGAAGKYVVAPVAHGALEAALSKIIPLLPEALRPNIKTLADIPDADLADAVEHLTHPDDMTPNLAAALSVTRTHAALDAINPYRPDAAGMATHASELQAAMDRIMTRAPIQQSVPYATSPAFRPRSADLSGGTALSSGNVGAAQTFKAMIGHAENASGSNSARSIYEGKVLSSALGRYQFLTGTWDRLYRNHFGDQDLSPSEIAAKRTDPNLQETLMNDLIAQNTHALQQIGAPVTAGNLYLAHFAGGGGARKVLSADPAMALSSIMSGRAMNANRFIKYEGKPFAQFTAQDLIDWAAHKMGGPRPAPHVGGVALPDAGDDVIAGLNRDKMALDTAQANLDAAAPASKPLVEPEISDYVDKYLRGEGRGDTPADLHMQQFANNNADAIEAELNRRQILPLPVHDGETIPILKTPIEQQQRSAAAPAPIASGLSQVLTPTGRVVDTQFQVHEASHLIGSDHPQYDQSLQPRDRSGRGLSDVQVATIAGNLDPAQLHNSRLASQGAPIIGPEGMVESGNGRVAAIRRAYAMHPQNAAAYRAMIEAQGHSIQGFKEPVLVRQRLTDMTPVERQAWTREANMRDTMAFSSTEQAKADAAALHDETLAHYQGGLPSEARNREFARRFMEDAVAPADRNAMVAKNGALSADGVRRIRSALLVKAYGDETSLISRVVEDTDTNIKAIGDALMNAAPAMAQLRAAIARGDVPHEMDISAHIGDMAALISHARDEGVSIANMLDQADAFAPPVDPMVRAWVRMAYDQSLTKARAGSKLSQALQYYAEEAKKVQSGPGLFGDAIASTRPEDLTDAAFAKISDPNGPKPDSLFDPSQPRPSRDGGGDPAGGGRNAEAARSASDSGSTGNGAQPPAQPLSAQAQARLKEFSDPVVQPAAATAQADSVLHDLQLHLAANPAALVQLGDGDPITLAAFLDSLKQDEAALNAIAHCMTPEGGLV